MSICSRMRIQSADLGHSEKDLIELGKRALLREAIQYLQRLQSQLLHRMHELHTDQDIRLDFHCLQ